jgi:hypothetical protein
MILHNSNTLKEKTKLENNTLKKLYCRAFLGEYKTTRDEQQEYSYQICSRTGNYKCIFKIFMINGTV